MALQNLYVLPGYENLELKDVFPAYLERRGLEFDMCLVSSRDKPTPTRLDPDSVFVLSDILVNGVRPLTKIERILIGRLPFSFIKEGEREDSFGVGEDAKVARYSFYHR